MLIRHFWFPLSLVRLQFFDAQHLVIEPLPVAKMGSDLRHVRNQKKSRTFFKNTFIRKEIHKCHLLLGENIQKVKLTCWLWYGIQLKIQPCLKFLDFYWKEKNINTKFCHEFNDDSIESELIWKMITKIKKNIIFTQFALFLLYLLIFIS